MSSASRLFRNRLHGLSLMTNRTHWIAEEPETPFQTVTSCGKVSAYAPRSFSPKTKVT